MKERSSREKPGRQGNGNVRGRRGRTEKVERARVMRKVEHAKGYEKCLQNFCRVA
jgi:hypothetical protein